MEIKNAFEDSCYKKDNLETLYIVSLISLLSNLAVVIFTKIVNIIQIGVKAAVLI